MALDDIMVRKLNALSKKYPGKAISANVFITLIIFSIGMITLPLTSYFTFRYLSHGSTVIGAASAIITVHVILAAFVYRALKEPVAEIEMKND